METVPGLTKSVLGSVLLKVTVTPPGGAATGRVSGNAVRVPSTAVTPEGSPIGPALTTETFAVVSGMNGGWLAWITDEPRLTPVTCTFAVVAFAANVTLAGTVATAVLLELRPTVRPPAGAAADSVRVKVLTFSPVMVAVGGLNVTPALT